MKPVVVLSYLVAVLLLFALPLAPASAAGNSPPYYSVMTVALPDGRSLEKTVIHGPARPPLGYEKERAPANPLLADQVDGSKVLEAPAYSWYYGCSATSGAMIAAYYDRGSYPNLYTGPTGNGVLPLNSDGWGPWTDGSGDEYAQCPLTATRVGLDGRTDRGSIEDYWTAYGDEDVDPYVANDWAEHAWGTAIGDYMRTSQSESGNSDGSTTFWGWTSSPDRLTCQQMEDYDITDDGTYGRKLFYQIRGYAVTDCYNQQTDNNTSGGFSFANYRAEIDAGNPVMINLAGHTIVGVGYNTSGNLVYIHDTWDGTTHQMTWGGSYSGMSMKSVSMVHIALPKCPLPASIDGLNVTLDDEDTLEIEWNPATNADHYEVWSGTTEPYFGPEIDCTHPGAFSCTVVTETAYESALSDPGGLRTYVLRAVNSCGITAAQYSQRAGTFQFELPGGGE